jgi:hypothetical protein
MTHDELDRRREEDHEVAEDDSAFDARVITDYLAGGLSPEERAAVEQRLQVDAAFRELKESVAARRAQTPEKAPEAVTPEWELVIALGESLAQTRQRAVPRAKPESAPLTREELAEHERRANERKRDVARPMPEGPRRTPEEMAAAQKVLDEKMRPYLLKRPRFLRRFLVKRRAKRMLAVIEAAQAKAIQRGTEGFEGSTPPSPRSPSLFVAAGGTAMVIAVGWILSTLSPAGSSAPRRSGVLSSVVQEQLARLAATGSEGSSAESPTAGRAGASPRKSQAPQPGPLPNDVLRDSGLVARIPGVQSRVKVRPIGDLPPLITNGFRADAWSGEEVRLPLPGSAKILLLPKTHLIFSGDWAPTMNALLSGEVVLEVPAASRWEFYTLGGVFTVGEGRYAIRTGKQEDGVAISIERGRVEAYDGSVEGTGVFARVNAEAASVVRVEDGTGYPVFVTRR